MNRANNLNSLIALSLAFYLIVVMSACGRCGGCNEIITTKGASVEIEDSLDAKYEHQWELKIIPEITERNGDRNCMYKDLAICGEDGILTNLLQISCDHDLPVDRGMVKAGENLLLKDSTESSGYPGGRITKVISFSRLLDTGRYQLILSGATKEGKPIRDTTYLTMY